MLTPIGLLVALALAAPALWEAADGSLGLGAALLRLAAALILVGVGTAVLRTILTPGTKPAPAPESGSSNAEAGTTRRREDS